MFVDRINLQGKLCQTANNALSKEMLEKDKCYMLDCNKEIFVWMGRQTLLTERRTAIKAIEVSFLFPFASKKARFSKYLSFSQSVLCSAIIRVLIHTSIVSNFHLLYNIPLRIYILAKIVLLLVSTSF